MSSSLSLSRFVWIISFLLFLLLTLWKAKKPKRTLWSSTWILHVFTASEITVAEVELVVVEEKSYTCLVDVSEKNCSVYVFLFLSFAVSWVRIEFHSWRIHREKKREKEKEHSVYVIWSTMTGVLNELWRVVRPVSNFSPVLWHKI